MNASAVQVDRSGALELLDIAQNVKKQQGSFTSTFLIQHDLMDLNKRLAQALNFTNPGLTSPEQTRSEIREVSGKMMQLLDQLAYI